MYNIKYSETFELWLNSLKDCKAKAIINTRLSRLRFGNFGDIKPVGDGVSELRIHYGCGYRIYLYRYGNTTIVLLCGGIKNTQPQDIQKAKEMKQCLTKQLLN